MNAIEVFELNKYFKVAVNNSSHVLKGLNFRIQKNRLTSITGKSGSGKSTLLYLLSTLDSDFDGEIIIDGHNIRSKSKAWLADYRNRHIGFIFQFHFLLPEFTVLENVVLPAMKLGELTKKEMEHDAIELLVMLDLGDHLYKKASMLSGGQKQRVAIARALINKPSIIIGDEPTGNLDNENTEIVLKLFKRLTTENRQTVITVTHDRDFARQSDHVIQMSDGIIYNQS
jgi:lipoprotein-releasing system ATP-binding protein